MQIHINLQTTLNFIFFSITNTKHPFIYYTFARLSPSFYSKIILLNSMKILTYFYTKKVIWSLVIFRMILMSQKKEEVYNILIINNLYINIYFFCFQFLEKWQVTSDNLPIIIFNALIFSELRTQICHFSVSLFPELSLFDCNQKCTNRAIWGVNR